MSFVIQQVVFRADRVEPFHGCAAKVRIPFNLSFTEANTAKAIDFWIGFDKPMFIQSVLELDYEGKVAIMIQIGDSPKGLIYTPLNIKQIGDAPATLGLWRQGEEWFGTLFVEGFGTYSTEKYRADCLYGENLLLSLETNSSKRGDSGVYFDRFEILDCFIFTKNGRVRMNPLDFTVTAVNEPSYIGLNRWCWKIV